MGSLTNISFLGSFAIIVLYTLNPSVCNTVCQLGIVFFGILHGINDIRILSLLKITGCKSKLCFQIVYLLLMIATLTAFTFFPLIMFTAFLFISAYHFGEQQFCGLNFPGNQLARFSFFISYGSLILCMLFLSHLDELNTAFNQLTGYEVSYVPIILIIISMAAVSNLLRIYLSCKPNINLLGELLLLLSIGSIFTYLDIVPAFAIYFLMWHSLPSIVTQIRFLYKLVAPWTFMKYVQTGIAYYFAALLLSAIYFVFVEPNIENAVVHLITAATIPHVITMYHLSKRIL